MDTEKKAATNEEFLPAETVKDPSQDPIKKELEKSRQPRTQREKLLFTRNRIDKQLSELESEEGETVEPLDEDEDKPVTVGMLKAREKEMAKKTALDLAESIEDEDEKNLTKHYLETRVVPSGNPAEDLRFARAAVTSLKATQIAAEMGRKMPAKKSGSGSGAPAKLPEDIFEPSADELRFMRPPFNLTKEQIIAARPK